jgi:hypothetical protein
MVHGGGWFGCVKGHITTLSCLPFSFLVYFSVLYMCQLLLGLVMAEREQLIETRREAPKQSGSSETVGLISKHSIPHCGTRIERPWKLNVGR